MPGVAVIVSDAVLGLTVEITGVAFLLARSAASGRSQRPAWWFRAARLYSDQRGLPARLLARTGDYVAAD